MLPFADFVPRQDARSICVTKVDRVDTAFRLLVIADMHYAPSAAEAAEAPPERRCACGLELVCRAIADARLRGGFDAIAMVGDLLNNGNLPSAAGALTDLRDTVAQAAPDTPLLVAPGNHDGDAGLVHAIFETRSGLRELGGYRFVTFTDAYDTADRCTRREEDRRLLRRLAGEPGGPIVVLQHNPLYPPIESDYPYMLTNGEGVLLDYAEANVLLSLSGHYHAGQPPANHNRTLYFTAPALAEAPFSYAIATLSGTRVSVKTRHLKMAASPAIIDSHIHTEFGYCAQDVRAGPAIERARMLGLAGICLVEHAPQLYCLSDDFFVGRHIARPALWRTNEHNRAAEYRRALTPLRSPFVRVGLEVELDGDGQLTLHDEDREWPDVLVGAVHFVPEDFTTISAPRLTQLFMRATEGLLAAGVDILAHPWRIFRWARQPVPTGLFGPVAQGLAQTRTAVEINLHGNEPDPDFLAECLARGVKVALGSDAHWLFEVGALNPHLDLLRRVAGTDDVGRFLVYP